MGCIYKIRTSVMSRHEAIRGRDNFDLDAAQFLGSGQAISAIIFVCPFLSDFQYKEKSNSTKSQILGLRTPLNPRFYGLYICSLALKSLRTESVGGCAPENDWNCWAPVAILIQKFIEL